MNLITSYNEFVKINENTNIGEDFYNEIKSVENLGLTIITDLLNNKNVTEIRKKVNDFESEVDEDSASVDQEYNVEYKFNYDFNGKIIPLTLYSTGNVSFTNGTYDKSSSDTSGTGWNFKTIVIDIDDFAILLDTEYDDEIDTSKVDFSIKEKIIEKIIPWIF